MRDFVRNRKEVSEKVRDETFLGLVFALERDKREKERGKSRLGIVRLLGLNRVWAFRGS